MAVGWCPSPARSERGGRGHGTSLGVAGVVLVSLACGGLDFSAPSLEDATHAEATAAGYQIPDGAVHVYVHDFGVPDARSTYFRYTLPESAFEAQRAEARTSGRYTEHDAWSVPESWPDYSGFGADAAVPGWWTPTGGVVLRRSTSAHLGEGGSNLGSGAQVAFDADTHTVYLWQWQWEWWTDPTAGERGELTIALDGTLPHPVVEVICAPAYRNRAKVVGGTATLKGVPLPIDCALRLRGGQPVDTDIPLKDGSMFSCSRVGEGVVCPAQ